MTALTIDAFAVFVWFVIVAAVVAIAGVIITHTPDVDSMGDPTPRLGEQPGPYEHPGPYTPADITYDHASVPPEVMARINAARWPDRSAWDQQ